ncbi:MAG: hypothetical protein HEQ32_08810 [Vampirovibrio sp.]|jgi:hypothetical protein
MDSLPRNSMVAFKIPRKPVLLVSQDPLSKVFRQKTTIIQNLLAFAQEGLEIETEPVQRLFVQYSDLFPKEASYIKENYKSLLEEYKQNKTWLA